MRKPTKREIVGWGAFVIMLPVVVAGVVFSIIKEYFNSGCNIAEVFGEALDEWCDK